MIMRWQRRCMPVIGEQDEAELLILGRGTGTYAMQCSRYYPNMTAEGVEIDELISDEMEYYKEIYREQGIRGLLENF